MKISQNHSNSFFVEITLTVLFFAISATVILQLFAMAGKTANRSSDLNGAVLQAQSIAEEVRGLTGADELPASLKNAQAAGTRQYRLKFDKSWKQTDGQPYYTVDVTLKNSAGESGTMVGAEIRVALAKQTASDPLYTLQVSKYLPRAN
ncbi:MAG: hypothetical protein GX424_05540 [Clostridiales bacterium]|jgi:type II secretory pathway pseudopilin PulG|nr:hypothetical protein [Clostridiales bacterium]